MKQEIYHRITPVKSDIESVTFKVTIKIALSIGWIENVIICFSDVQGTNKSVQLQHYKNDERYAYFQTEVVLETKALYYYHFSFLVNGKFMYYKRNLDNNTTISKEEEWKISVNFDVPDWAKGAIMYHIFVDRFRKSTKCPIKSLPNRVLHENWNEVPTIGPDENGKWNIDFFGGNLKGIEDSLKYIKSLNVDIIYLSPIMQSQSNHRYDTANYERVDPYAGCNKHLQELCEAAHRKGIKIILDAVFNHTGDDSRYFNRYGNFPEIGAYQSKLSKYYPYYKRAWDKDKETFCYWWGMKNLPECDSYSKEWTEYICGENGIIDQWFKLGIDGLRLDVADELSDDFIENIKIAVKRNKKDALIIGEVWKNPMRMNRGYITSGKCMHTVMNYPLADALIRYFKYTDIQKLEKVFKEILLEYPRDTIFTLMNFTSTHDISRPINIFGCDNFQYSGEWAWNLKNENYEWVKEHNEINVEERKYGKQIFKAFVFSLVFLPGIFSIFYGDEVGTEGLGNLLNRVSYPWQKRDKKMLKYFRKITKVRKKFKFLKTAETNIVSIDEKKFVFERYNDDEKILVIINRTHNIINIDKFDDVILIEKLGKSSKKEIGPYGAIALYFK